MNNIMISVIVPVYNSEKFLEKSLKSLSEQTIDSIEFICVNDGSTDSSLDILNDFAERDHRFKIIDQKNRGVSAARNAALDIASGEYIMFMDSDDWYSKDTCMRALNYIVQYKADIVLYSMKMEYLDDSVIRSAFDESAKFPAIPRLRATFCSSGAWRPCFMTLVIPSSFPSSSWRLISR